MLRLLRLLNSARKKAILSNRHYIKSLAEILLLCAKQEIAIRGHRESADSLNQGNFMEILRLLGKHDGAIGEKLCDSPQNAVYTSPDIQYQLLEIMGGIMREKVCIDVQNAVYFSLLVDETKDVSKVEQMAIVVRYVHLETATIYERFLRYVPAANLTAESLTTYILDTLREHHLDPTHIVSQGYDGAAVMSGSCSGVQARIREIAPQAIYIHCNAHCLNLCLVDCVKVPVSSLPFLKLYVFLSSSKCHALFVQIQKDLFPDKQVRQLQKLSDTRWACRQSAVNAVCYTYNAVLSTLTQLVSQKDGIRAAQARGLLSQIKSFHFLLSLVTFDRLLSTTKSLSDVLQSTQLNLAKAADLVTATEDALKSFRSDDEWEKIVVYCESVARLQDISTGYDKRERRIPKRFQDTIVLETTGNRDTGTTSYTDQFKHDVYYPVLDAFLHEMEQRFDNRNKSIMRALQACNPTSSQFLVVTHLQPLISLYSLDQHALELETPLAKRTVAKQNLEELSDVIIELAPLKAAFPTLMKLLQIALTLSVSTAKCERCFSALKRIKTYLHNSMSQQRLSDLAILSIERDMSDKLDLEVVVDIFATKSRRIELNF